MSEGTANTVVPEEDVFCTIKEGTAMQKEIRWLIGIMMSVMLIVGLPLLSQVAMLGGSVEDLSTDVRELTITMQKVVQNDLSDIKARLMVVERKDILPKSEAKIEVLEDKMQELRNEITKLQNGKSL